MALWVVVVYPVVQLIESHLITPLFENRAVHVPPAVTLSGEVIMAILFGLVGVFLSAPLLVVVIILVQMLYREDVLGVKSPSSETDSGGVQSPPAHCAAPPTHPVRPPGVRT